MQGLGGQTRSAQAQPAEDPPPEAQAACSWPVDSRPPLLRTRMEGLQLQSLLGKLQAMASVGLSRAAAAGAGAGAAAGAATVTTRGLRTLAAAAAGGGTSAAVTSQYQQRQVQRQQSMHAASAALSSLHAMAAQPLLPPPPQQAAQQAASQRHVSMAAAAAGAAVQHLASSAAAAHQFAGAGLHRCAGLVLLPLRSQLLFCLDACQAAVPKRACVSAPSRACSAAPAPLFPRRGVVTAAAAQPAAAEAEEAVGLGSIVEFERNRAYLIGLTVKQRAQGWEVEVPG